MKIDKKKGILFWVTGLSGSGKTSIAKKILKSIQKKFGKTIVVSGDDLRGIFSFKSYTRKERADLGIKYSKFAKFITDQKINLIFAVVGMRHKIRSHNKKTIKNYIEIFIKSDINRIIKLKKKKVYLKSKKNIVGLGISPEFPKKPDITIENDCKKDINKLSSETFKKISKILR